MHEKEKLASFKTLEKNFKNFDLNFSQENMQDYLNFIYINNLNNLNPVLEKLSEWEYGVGYLTEGKLKDNLRFSYPDPETNINFKTQINIARSNYSPKPLDANKLKNISQNISQNILKLHCPICFENIGLGGIPGKENLRAFSLELGLNRNFFIQFTPFPLFPYHCVLIDQLPRPMIMSEQSVIDLTNFIQKAPGYTGCSNSDVEWAGASILIHHHYQVFKDLKLPIMDAEWDSKNYKKTNIQGYTLEFGFLNYPIACIKLMCRDLSVFTQSAGALIRSWKAQDPGKNTLNLIIKYDELKNTWIAYLILRNPDHRTSPDLAYIKSEGVGIIEVAGEGIYPVPKDGENKTGKEILEEIKTNGLEIIKTIIQNNNPLDKKFWPEQFLSFEKIISELADLE